MKICLILISQYHHTNMKNKKIFIVIVALIVLMFASYKAFSFMKDKYHFLRDNIEKIEEYTKNNIRHYDFDYSWADSNRLVAHAFGGKGTKTYTNSKEAFEYNYDLGHRVFEVDFDLTNDGKTICSHDEDYWRYITGNENNDIEYSYDNFINTPLFNDYTPLDGEDIIDLLKQYQDIYIITDTKYYDELSIYKQFSQFVDYAKKNDPETLDRLIPQIYNKEMLDYVMNVYPFKSVIFTLYQTDWQSEDLASYCYRSGIRFITISEDIAQEEDLSFWDSLNIKVAVHTINDQKTMDDFIQRGADVIYTDFLVPERNEEMNKNE